MRHLKGLLHKKGEKPSSSSSKGGGDDDDNPPETKAPSIVLSPPEEKQESPSADKTPEDAQKEKKHKHKHKSKTEDEGKRKHHTKRARSHEYDGKETGEDGAPITSPLRVCEPVTTPSNMSENNESEGEKEPPAVVQKISTSNSDSIDVQSLQSSGFKLPFAPAESSHSRESSHHSAKEIVIESRGRQRSGAFYDVAPPVIGDNGGVCFSSKDLPQPSTVFRVTTGCSTLPEGVSWSLRFSIGVADTIGRRAKMEDTFAVIGQFGSMPMRDLFLVCDGHNGSDASKAVTKLLPGAVQKRISQSDGNEVSVVKALKDAFVEVNDQLESDKVPGGTTATAVFADVDGLYVAHVGDSRAVLIKGTTAKALTTDHRPKNSAEAKAIVARGGTIATVGNELRVNGILAVTRALGDRELSGVISAVPDVCRFTFDFEPDSALVIACDGLWDHLSEQDVADVIDTFKDPFCAAQELRNLAYQSGSADNITVIVIRAAS